MPSPSIWPGKRAVFRAMETPLRVAHANVFGISSERNAAEDRLTAAWRLPQHLLWGAKPDLWRCSGVHSNLLKILYWGKIITLMSQMCLLALAFFFTSPVQDEICNPFPELYFISSVA